LTVADPEVKGTSEVTVAPMVVSGVLTLRLVGVWGLQSGSRFCAADLAELGSVAIKIFSHLI
jgi:hypothetical protein